MTVVNQTFAELQLNHKHIRDIEAYISTLHDHVLKWTKVSDTAFERIRTRLQIDRCLSALESVHLFLIHQLGRYQRQHKELETGLLTEDILQPTDLCKHLTTSRQGGLIAQRLEWYYEFVHIQAMREVEDHLVFTADID